MSSQTNTLTEGPLAKQIFLVSLPLALSNLLVARFYGARHPKDVEKTVHSAAIISAVAGVVLLLIGLLGSPCHAAAAAWRWSVQEKQRAKFI